jgi:drug/metabolite transporter (DMT)-like permease
MPPFAPVCRKALSVITLTTALKTRRADTLMILIVLVWGLNYIVMKDGLSDIDPLTFNALRFMLGAPVIGLVALRDRSILRLPRRYWREVGLATLLSALAYQILFLEGLDRTTSTNAALLGATMPTWTGAISILVGLVEIRRRLLAGIAITLLGVALVVFSRAGSDFSLSGDDLIGSLLVLASAVLLGGGNLVRKTAIDHVGSLRMAVWSYWLTAAGLTIVAAPNLLTLSAADVPLRSLPNVLYSGWIASVGGFMIVSYALGEIGPTRTATYFNFNPIVASCAGILILGEPFSIWLLVGGAMTLGGVMLVRQNVYARRRPSAPHAVAETAPEPAPAAGK